MSFVFVRLCVSVDIFFFFFFNLISNKALIPDFLTKMKKKKSTDHQLCVQRDITHDAARCVSCA